MPTAVKITRLFGLNSGKIVLLAGEYSLGEVQVCLFISYLQIINGQLFKSELEQLKCTLGFGRLL